MQLNKLLSVIISFYKLLGFQQSLGMNKRHKNDVNVLIWEGNKYECVVMTFSFVSFHFINNIIIYDIRFSIGYNMT